MLTIWNQQSLVGLAFYFSLFLLTQQEAGAHPITGIIVLVLAVIQPIMALFRPHPGEAKYVDFFLRYFLYSWLPI